jgi:hypothetical protein
MYHSSRISLAPRTSVALWLGAVAPVAAGFATGGLAAAFGAAFTAGCPLLVVSSARWPVRAPRIFPLYFVALFVAALTAFEFNSVAFVVDTWSALLLGLVTIPAGRLRMMNPRDVAHGDGRIMTAS